jgi:transposase
MLQAPPSLPEGLLMLGPPKVGCLDQPVTASLEDLVEPDNFYRRLAAALDLSFVREWVADCYAPRGRPSIDPVVFFKLQLIMFFEGIRSERQLMETVRYHVAHRWYLRYQLDEPLPDHSSLTRIRERLGLPIFQRFFDHVVALCQQAGLVWGKELFFDGTKVRAHADLDSLVPRWYAAAKAHLDDVFATESEPEPPAAVPRSVPDPQAPVSLPFAGTADAEQALAAANEATWKLLDQQRLDPSRPASGSYQRITDVKVSTTDADATPMSTDGATKLGYHDHYVVDGGRARIILAALVTPADVQDNQALLDLLDRVRFRSHLHVRRVVADSKYATGENLRAVAERGMQALMPVVDYEQSTPFFRQRDFVYDAAQDHYTCPGGQTLTFRGNSYTTRVRTYQAPPAACQACPLRPQCTDSRQGRRLNRAFDEAYREQARADQETPAFAKAMRKRQVWVEPLFGEAKDWHGLRRFRLRGLWKVNCEALRIAAGQNLKRLLSRARWGRRPGPAAGMAHATLVPALTLVLMRLSACRPCRGNHFSTRWVLFEIEAGVPNNASTQVRDAVSEVVLVSMSYDRSSLTGCEIIGVCRLAMPASPPASRRWTSSAMP